MGMWTQLYRRVGIGWGWMISMGTGVMTGWGNILKAV